MNISISWIQKLFLNRIWLQSPHKHETSLILGNASTTSNIIYWIIWHFKVEFFAPWFLRACVRNSSVPRVCSLAWGAAVTVHLLLSQIFIRVMRYVYRKCRRANWGSDKLGDEAINHAWCNHSDCCWSVTKRKRGCLFAVSNEWKCRRNCNQSKVRKTLQFYELYSICSFGA